MQSLLEVVAKLGSEMHPHRVEAVASALEGIQGPGDLPRIIDSFGAHPDKGLVGALKLLWHQNLGVSPIALAFALRGASRAAILTEAKGAVELVWTGPYTTQVPVRQTEQVLLQIIHAAKARLFLVSFVAYKVPSIISALQQAAGRDVRIDFLLELSSEQGGKIFNHDSLKAVRQSLPSAKLYLWQKGAETETPAVEGSVHAKCAVADGEIAFVTSANVTAAAMEKNMELGVLVKGGPLPRELHDHLESLIDSKIIRQAP